MFDLTGRAFRFGNVVGPRQTHGVGFDFVRRLLRRPDAADDPGRRQAEQVLHPRRATSIAAVLTAAERADGSRSRAFNVATGDYITVTEIAELALEVLGLDPGRRAVRVHRRRPRLEGRRARSCGSNTDRIRALGWTPTGGCAPRRCASSMARHARRRSRRAALTREARPAVFLDRDGVLNEAVVRDGAPAPAASRRRARAAARRRPRRARACATPGFLLVVVTNQPDIARGTHDRGRGRRASTTACAPSSALDDVVVCPHDDADGCACRKPQPGHDPRRRRPARPRPRRAASWSATAGATSRPAPPPGVPTVFGAQRPTASDAPERPRPRHRRARRARPDRRCSTARATPRRPPDDRRQHAHA